jgi:hypothetical protein
MQALLLKQFPIIPLVIGTGGTGAITALTVNVSGAGNATTGNAVALFTTSPSDFSRNRKLPLTKIIGMLINLPKRSLNIELQSFFESLEQPGFCCTKGAFSLQRPKLKPIFFKVWNDFLVLEFYNFYGNDVKRWEGFRLLAVDGSNLIFHFLQGLSMLTLQI